jgi:hypothetical protein
MSRADDRRGGGRSTDAHRPGGPTPSTDDLDALLIRLDELGSENDVLLARIATDSVRLGALEADLRATRHQTATVEAELAKLDARYETDTGTLRHQLGEVHDQYLRMEELLRAEQARCQARDRHIERLQNSVSYRLTKPLRFVQKMRLARRSANRPADPN